MIVVPWEPTSPIFALLLLPILPSSIFGTSATRGGCLRAGDARFFFLFVLLLLFSFFFFKGPTQCHVSGSLSLLLVPNTGIYSSAYSPKPYLLLLLNMIEVPPLLCLLVDCSVGSGDAGDVSATLSTN